MKHFLIKNNNNLFVYVNNIQNSQYTIEICDMLGELVHLQTLKKENIQIDMSAYQSGIYFIQIINDNQIVYTNKLIKL